MRLGLGIGVPYGSGVLNPDKLSLDLQFATDKTLTARKGPTPTFTRVSTATFVGSNGLIQSAAIDAPRFDHDPITLACKGLLIEESRTNLALQSETFPLPTWVKTNVTTSPNSIASPNGAVTADTLVEDTATSFHHISQQFAKVASPVTYSYSIYYKNASGTRTVVLALTNGTTSGKAAIFTTSGTVTATNINIGSGAGFTFVSANVESVGNNWYRASVVVTSNTSTRLDAVTYLNNSTTVINSYTGNMSSVYLWGAQVEEGSSPTSYIPTTTASLVRSADACTISGSDFTELYSTTGLTFLCEVSAGLPNSNVGILSLTDIFNTADILTFSGLSLNSSGANLNELTLFSPLRTPNVFTKVAFSEDPIANNMSISLGGSDTDSQADSNAGFSFTDLAIGQGLFFAGFLNGHIKFLRYYKKALSNSKIKSLTSP